RTGVLDGTFHKNHGMSLDSFHDLLDIVRPDITPSEVGMAGVNRGGIVPAHQRLSLTLGWLRGSINYSQVAAKYGIGLTTAYDILWQVIQALKRAPQLSLKLPSTEAEYAALARGFKARSSNGVMDKCIGAVDGMLVRIRVPTLKDTPTPVRYYSGHKKFCGINLQAICDHNCRFLGMDMREPGSVNDRKAWEHSGIDDWLSKLPDGYYLVGDAAYPLGEHLLTPFKGNVCSSQDTYNYYQSQTRMPIEQAFGMLSQKWAILKKPICFKLGRVPSVVHVLLRLHNWCIDHRQSDEGRNEVQRVSSGNSSAGARGANSAAVGIMDEAGQRLPQHRTSSVGLSGPSPAYDQGGYLLRDKVVEQIEAGGFTRPQYNIRAR
ncbi:unnamed protein product, partial [Chrysoparadoxa australica]